MDVNHKLDVEKAEVNFTHTRANKE